MGGNLEHRKRTGQGQNSGADDGNVVGKPVNSIQKGLNDLKGNIGSLCEHLAPSHGHGFKLCVNIIRRHQQRIFHNIRRDLAFSGQGSDFADGFTQIICNGLNDGLGVLKDAVQFLATKDTGRHGLCKL